MFWAYAASFYYGGWLMREGLMTDVDSVLKVFFAVVMSSMGSSPRISTFVPLLQRSFS
jgi:hypothetical protein